MKIPEQYLPVMPYIIINDAKVFLQFTKDVFLATEQLIVPGVGERKIMHGEIRINEAVIMFADTPDGFTERSCGMFIYIENVDDTYKRAMDNNASTLMPPSQQEYGYTAGFEDPFKNQWWIVQP